jgi:heptosyltransferase I
LNILIIKLSSLGDVLHNLPIVWDLRAQYPEAQIDWVVEDGYVHLLQPLLTRPGFKGIDRIIPIAMRRWKKSLFHKKTRMELKSFLKNLRLIRYDMVIETQGLLKAALVTRLAKCSHGAVIAGLANATEDSGYEPVSRWFYTQCVIVPKQCHAVDRSRLVAAAAMNVIQSNMKTSPPQFYPQTFVEQLAQKSSEISPQFTQPYVLFFHSTARAAKQWNESHWVEVGRYISAQGKRVILPWGNAKEKQESQRLCAKIPGSIVPEAFSLEQAFSIVAGAEMTIGVDTGLTHLSAIMYKPTIEIYCDSPRWKTEGFWSAKIKNLGDTASPPDVKQVLAAIVEVLR